MAAIVGIDALIEYSTDGGTTWIEMPERNEFSISISVDAAEHRVFVPSLADAWVEKARTWMSWSGSMAGYYDAENDAIFNTMVAGEDIDIKFYDTRSDLTRYWYGKVLLTSIEKSTNTEEFVTLSVDFEGQGRLYRQAP
jgi:hypothetical protein